MQGLGARGGALLCAPLSTSTICLKPGRCPGVKSVVYAGVMVLLRRR